MIFLFNWVIFRFHVNFPEGNEMGFNFAGIGMTWSQHSMQEAEEDVPGDEANQGHD